MVNYFEIFQNFFFLDRGVGGWGVSYPKFFGTYAESGPTQFDDFHKFV